MRHGFLPTVLNPACRWAPWRHDLMGGTLHQLAHRPAAGVCPGSVPWAANFSVFEYIGHHQGLRAGASHAPRHAERWMRCPDGAELLPDLAERVYMRDCTGERAEASAEDR
eukprot:gene48358-39189_t